MLECGHHVLIVTVNLIEMKQLLNAPDWYNYLPEEYRKKALHSIKTAQSKKLYPSLLSALSGGFIWASSRQGMSYWENVYQKIKEGKIKLKETV